MGNYLHFTLRLHRYFQAEKQRFITMLQLTVFMPISCPMRCRRHYDFLNVVTSTFARHSLNARNVINWERNFKENLIKKYLGERIRK